MSLRLAVLKSVFNSYDKNAFPLIFLFIALVYFLVKAKKKYTNLLMFEIFGILLLVTPFIGNKIVTLGAGREANWPVYGILCVISLTAYIIIEVVSEQQSKKEKLFLMFVLLLTVQLGLGFSITGKQFTVPGANQKLSDTAVEVAKLFVTKKEPYVMAPAELAGDIREYSDEIRVFYTEGYNELQKDLRLLQSEAEYYGCNYIILHVENDEEPIMTGGGYDMRTCIGEYVIYGKNTESGK